MVKGAIYYTTGELDERISRPVQEQLREAFDGEIVACSLKPIEFGDKNIVLPLKKGYHTMFKQILACLEASTAEVIFFCEHDNLYHPTHFDFVPPKKDQFYYDRNWWKIRKDGYAVHWDADQVSGLCCYRQVALDWYQKKVDTFDANNFDRKFEPPGDESSEWWKAEFPCIDIRHERNLTYNKWRIEHFRKKDTALNFETSTIDKIPGWSADQLRALYL